MTEELSEGEGAVGLERKESSVWMKNGWENVKPIKHKRGIIGMRRDEVDEKKKGIEKKEKKKLYVESER